jgi:hydrogenase nickel incorporation protein HypA/HybF
MHELPVTESLLRIARQHAEKAGAARITDLYIVIGQLASIVDDSVQFYWDLISKDTPAEGAHLHFRRIPTEMLCLNCNLRYMPTQDELACPTCGSLTVQIVAGEEFYLEAMDVDGEKSVA